jgi:outer membrane protein OmpA-like peptidoglycan-associated protein
MKKIYFLIAFALQFSFSCFSQSDSLIHYTDDEKAKISDYINGLEKINPSANLSESDKKNKQEIVDLLSNSTHAYGYTNLEVIKLNNYIKNLEKAKAVAGVPTSHPKTPSNDSLHAYTDAEIVKLSNHISGLENKITAVNPSGINVDEKQQVIALLAIPSHEYTDKQVIIIANYIKHLAKQDSLNTAIAIAKVTEPVKEKEKEKTQPVKPGEEYPIDEKQEISKYEKLIFFDFNKATLKPESYKPLDDVVKILKSYVNLNFAVEGYCDSVGTAVYNLNLSNRRAATVKNYFISKGVPANRLTAAGFGKEYPIASNETEDGRAKNRRVVIKAKRK